MLVKHPFAELYTPNGLYLRRIKKTDARSFFANIFSDPVYYWLFYQIQYPTLESYQKEIDLWANGYKDNYFYRWTITKKDDDVPMGLITIHTIDPLNGSGEMGWAMGKPFIGNGYTTEAARSVLDFAFDEVGFHRISAGIVKQNLASIAIAEKLGMQYEGTQKEAWWICGEGEKAKYADQQIYSMINGQHRRRSV